MPFLDGNLFRTCRTFKTSTTEDVSYQICGFMYILTVKFSCHGWQWASVFDTGLHLGFQYYFFLPYLWSNHMQYAQYYSFPEYCYWSLELKFSDQSLKKESQFKSIAKCNHCFSGIFHFRKDNGVCLFSMPGKPKHLCGVTACYQVLEDFFLFVSDPFRICVTGVLHYFLLCNWVTPLFSFLSEWWLLWSACENCRYLMPWWDFRFFI
jgi:hypothetical protein